MTGGNRVSKPYLGANLQTVSSTVAQYYSMVLGAYVNNVAAGSCAEISGMKIGEIITEIDGFSIVTRDDVDNVLRSHSVGDTLSIKIWRAGEYLTLTVILDELRYVE